jgi:hypothetical protein
MPTLKKKCPFFFWYVVKPFYVNYKMVPEQNVNDDPADTFLKEGISIDITFDPC